MPLPERRSTVHHPPPDAMEPPPPARTPLASVLVQCSECGEEATARDINEDRVRYHLEGAEGAEGGAMIRLPDAGLTEDEIAKLQKMFLRCELCQEDQEEQDG